MLRTSGITFPSSGYRKYDLWAFVFFFILAQRSPKASSLIESCGTSCSCRYNGQSMTGHAYKKESETYWASILFSYNMALRPMFHYEKRDWAQGFLFFFITCGASINIIINKIKKFLCQYNNNYKY